jgi:hypothetical protein
MQYQKLASSSSHGFDKNRDSIENLTQDRRSRHADLPSSPRSTAVSSPFSIGTNPDDEFFNDLREDSAQRPEGMSSSSKLNASSCISWSRLTFSWIRPLLELGNKRPLVPEDLGKLDSEDVSTSIYSSFKHSWDNAANKQSLPWVLVEAFGFPFFMAGLLKLVHDSCLFLGKHQLWSKSLARVDT